MVSAPDPKVTNFLRSILQDGDRTLIESTCIHCGTKIIGSVLDGLPKLEADHLQREHGIHQVNLCSFLPQHLYG